jgi:hypothetical protein
MVNAARSTVCESGRTEVTERKIDEEKEKEKKKKKKEKKKTKKNQGRNHPQPNKRP